MKLRGWPARPEEGMEQLMRIEADKTKTTGQKAIKPDTARAEETPEQKE